MSRMPYHVKYEEQIINACVRVSLLINIHIFELNIYLNCANPVGINANAERNGACSYFRPENR